MMKVIFLDVDGVLNSMSYYEKVNITQHPLDREAIDCLARIVYASKALIVLSSSWRGGWQADPSSCDIQGRILNQYLSEAGLSIYDKTVSLMITDGSARCQEIQSWLHRHRGQIGNYLILDDGDFGWESYGMAGHWIRTDFMQGGLQEEHVADAVRILSEKWWMTDIKYRFRRILPHS